MSHEKLELLFDASLIPQELAKAFGPQYGVSRLVCSSRKSYTTLVVFTDPPISPRRPQTRLLLFTLRPHTSTRANSRSFREPIQAIAKHQRHVLHPRRSPCFRPKHLAREWFFDPGAQVFTWSRDCRPCGRYRRIEEVAGRRTGQEDDCCADWVE